MRVRVRVRMRVRVHMSMCVFNGMYACLYVPIHVQQTHMHMHTCLYVCTHVHKPAHMFIYTEIHVHLRRQLLHPRWFDHGFLLLYRRIGRHFLRQWVCCWAKRIREGPFGEQKTAHTHAAGLAERKVSEAELVPYATNETMLRRGSHCSKLVPEAVNNRWNVPIILRVAVP